MERSVKRISSLFSLGSIASEKSTSSAPPQITSQTLPQGPPTQLQVDTDTPPPILLRSPTADIRASASTPDLHSASNSRPPSIAPSTHSSRPCSAIGDQDALLPFNLKPLQIPGEERISRPSSRASSQASSRPISPPKFRPLTPTQEGRARTPIQEGRLGKRLSWLPGRPRSDTQNGVAPANMPQAWFVASEEKTLYDAAALVTFAKVPELWNDSGNTLVYLHSCDHGRGPSFKLDSSCFAASRKLSALPYGSIQRCSTIASSGPPEVQPNPMEGESQRLSVDRGRTPPRSQPGSSTDDSSPMSLDMDAVADPQRKEMHLYIPQALHADLTTLQPQLSLEDIERLIAVRNLFAFLTGQPLVATSHYPNLFGVLLKTVDLLQHYQFTNLDGSTLGEAVTINFGRIVDECRLYDVRASREKTIEAIVLGEQMRYLPLYNEGFVHGVGKWNDLVQLNSAKIHLISGTTRKRMERATIDLGHRLGTTRRRLNDMDFQTVFAGFASSTSSAESKLIDFKGWKSSFQSLRQHVIRFYREKYGNWPPKAKSKKNDFEESGLNRLALQNLYNDFASVYDTLVDRSNLTTRAVGAITDPVPSSDIHVDCIRRILGEYDTSAIPITPPIPYDVPIMPSLAPVRRNWSSLDPKKQRKETGRKLQDDEINMLLMQSYNRSSVTANPFLIAFMSFERRTAHNKTLDEIRDLRIGQWLFIYAVLQALPLLVVDAPGIKFSKGVEYFLCQIPLGSPPWMTYESHSRKQSWYNIAGSTGLVSLPPDIVEHGVEGVYQRSHCWQEAQKWSSVVDEEAAAAAAALSPSMMVPTSPELPMVDDSQTLLPLGSQPLSVPTRSSVDDHSPSPGPARRHRRSIHLGLEALPLPQGVVPQQARPVSTYDPELKFDNILGIGGDNDATKAKK